MDQEGQMTMRQPYHRKEEERQELEIVAECYVHGTYLFLFGNWPGRHSISGFM